MTNFAGAPLDIENRLPHTNLQDTETILFHPGRIIMPFENGLYAIRFQTPLGEGAGVAYLNGGKLRGGDSMMAYVGTYNEQSGTLNAEVRAYAHTNVPGMDSVFGAKEVDISLAGQINGGNAKLSGTAPQAPGVTLQVTMERLHD